MKIRYMTIAGCFLLATNFVLGQKQMREINREARSEKMKSHKIAFITSELDLTEEEAMRFWPIYNAREKEQKLNRETLLSDGQINTTSQADVFLDERVQHLKKQYESESNYIAKFKAILPSQKVAQLILVEQQFRDRLVETVRRRVRSRNR